MSVKMNVEESLSVAYMTSENVLPDKSKSYYEREFKKFEEWRRQQNNEDGITENTLLAYFDLQRQKYKSSTLWRTYRMLKACLSIYMNVDTSKYNKLRALLKKSSEGYTPTRSKILNEADIHKFIKEANDRIYLAMKVILIIGYNGSCRRQELTELCIDDIEYKSDSIMVAIPKTKSILPRQFLITDRHWIGLIKKYANLRPKSIIHKRFFLTYRKGFCFNSPIGINYMGKVPKEIAAFLELPNPELFTGHYFRRTFPKKHIIEVRKFNVQADSGCSTVSKQQPNDDTNRNISAISNVHQNLHGVTINSQETLDTTVNSTSGVYAPLSTRKFLKKGALPSKYVFANNKVFVPVWQHGEHNHRSDEDEDEPRIEITGNSNTDGSQIVGEIVIENNTEDDSSLLLDKCLMLEEDEQESFIPDIDNSVEYLKIEAERLRIELEGKNEELFKRQDQIKLLRVQLAKSDSLVKLLDRS